jgi:hypothetical protein
MQGRVVFLLMDSDSAGDLWSESEYLPMKERVMFRVFSASNDQVAFPSDIAFVKQDVSRGDYIQSIVRQGYIVRTRENQGVNQPLESGAQLISTDFEPKFDPECCPQQPFRVVELPNGLAIICNPVAWPNGSEGGCASNFTGFSTLW